MSFLSFRIVFHREGQFGGAVMHINRNHFGFLSIIACISVASTIAMNGSMLQLTSSSQNLRKSTDSLSDYSWPHLQDIYHLDEDPHGIGFRIASYGDFHMFSDTSIVLRDIRNVIQEINDQDPRMVGPAIEQFEKGVMVFHLVAREMWASAWNDTIVLLHCLGSLLEHDGVTDVRVAGVGFIDEDDIWRSLGAFALYIRD